MRVMVCGGGELGTATAHRLSRAGLEVVVREIARPTAVCRAICAAFAVYEGTALVDGIRFERADGVLQAEDILARRVVPVMAAPSPAMVERLRPLVLVDAVQPRSPRRLFARDEASLTLALGPGRVAGRDVRAVVVTAPLFALGAVLEEGEASDAPAAGSAFHPVHLVTAPARGIFVAHTRIGEAVVEGQTLGIVGQYPLVCPRAGYVRGLLADGIEAVGGRPVAELAASEAECFTISGWARAVAGGVLEAVLRLSTA